MQTLKESELRYRRLFEAAQDGILILDARTGMIDDVNAYLMNMLGYSREEFIKKKLWEVGAFKDIEASKDAFEALQESEYIRYEDLPLKTKDGRLIQVEFVSNVYRAGNEKVIQCNIRDTTAHRRIVAALQENEKKYHDLINQSPDGYFIIELSGNILTVNKAMCKELEFSEEELLSMSIWDIVPERFLDQYRQRLTKILEGKSLKEAAEYEVRGKDGKTHYVEVLSAPRYNGKDIIGFQGVARDITARKQAEDALRASKSIIEGIINAIPVRVFWKDKNLVYLGCNTVFARDKGFSDPMDVIGKDDYQMASHDQAELYRADDRQVIESGSSKILVEESQTTPEGNTSTLLTSKVPLRSSEGEIIGVLGTYMDITERKLAEDALRRSGERYRALFEDMPVSIWEQDFSDVKKHLDSLKEEGVTDFHAYFKANPDAVRECNSMIKVLDVNQATLKLYRADSKEDLFRGVDEIPSERMMGQLRDILIAISEGRDNYTWEGADETMAGEPIEIHLSWSVVPGHEIDFSKVIVTTIDITERKQAEQRLRDSEKRFRTIFDQAPVAMALVDEQGHPFISNPLLSKMVGYSNDELSRMKFTDFTHPEDADKDLKQFNALVEGTIPAYRLEKRYIHKNGELVWANLVVTILRDENGRQQDIIGMAEDITPRKRAETETRQRLRELEVLYQSGLAFSQLINPKAIAEKIIDLLDQEMDWHHTAIRLYHPESETLELQAFQLPHLNNPEERRAAEARLKSMQRVGQGLSGWVFQHGQVVRSNDLKNDPRYFETFPGLQSGLYTPIKINERVLGVISIESDQANAFSESDERLTFTLAGQAAIAIENATLFDNVQRINSELMLAYETTLEGWSLALDLRDKETEGHTRRVTELTVKLARAFGLSEPELVNVRRGGLLHDIGKMGVPDNILLKPGELTEDEWKQMRMHPIYAYDMLSHIAYLHEALDIPYCHHEKWDGTGYPRGLKGEEIPLSARIFAVVDVWDALRSDRPYRAGWSEDEAREYIRSSSGTYFDPQVVDVFLRVPG